MKTLQLRQTIYLLFMWLSLIGAAGCTSMGYTDVDTTRKAILVANAEVRAANFLLQDLINRGAIGRSQADSALRSLNSALAQLQTALTAIDSAGDPVLAENNLERAKVSLSVVMALLAPLVET
jgi:hypothetical protein